MDRLDKLKRTIRMIGAGIVFVFGLMVLMIHRYADGIEREAKSIMYFLNGISLLAGVFIYLLSFHIRMCMEKEKGKRENKNEKAK